MRGIFYVTMKTTSKRKSTPKVEITQTMVEVVELVKAKEELPPIVIKPTEVKLPTKAETTKKTIKPAKQVKMENDKEMPIPPKTPKKASIGDQLAEALLLAKRNSAKALPIPEKAPRTSKPKKKRKAIPFIEVEKEGDLFWALSDVKQDVNDAPTDLQKCPVCGNFKKWYLVANETTVEAVCTPCYKAELPSLMARVK